MNSSILVVVILTWTIAFARPSASAQAAAESAAMHATSATATAKAGSTLGSVLNRATSQIGDRVQQEVSHPASVQKLRTGSKPTSTNAVRNTAVSPDSAPSEGLLITSIDGAESSCPVKPTPSPAPEKAATQPAQTNCTPPDSANKTKYKSTVTVSF